MSVPMVELAHVEALWAKSDDPEEREADLQALRESAVPGADATETAVILPAGWVLREAKIETPGRYVIHKRFSGNQRFTIQRAYDCQLLGMNGEFVYCLTDGGHEFPSAQAAVDALKAVCTPDDPAAIGKGEENENATDSA